MSFSHPEKMLSVEDTQKIDNLTCVEDELVLAMELQDKYANQLSRFSFKADTLISFYRLEKTPLNQRTYQNKISDDELYKIVKYNPYFIERYKRKRPFTKQCQIRVCEYDPALIRYIPNQCEEAKLLACRNIYNMKFIKSPTKEMWEIAMKELKEAPRTNDADLFGVELYIKKAIRHAYRTKAIDKQMDSDGEKYFDKVFAPEVTKLSDNVNNAITTRNETKYMMSHVVGIFSIFKIITKTMSAPFRIFNPVTLLNLVKHTANGIINEIVFDLRDKDVARVMNARCDYRQLVMNILVEKQGKTQYKGMI